MLCHGETSPDRSTLDWLAKSQPGDIILGIDRQFKLTCFNKAYLDFYLQNGGSAQELERCLIGSSLLEGIAGPMRDFYARHLRHVIETGESWKHRYECSSSQLYRLFEMNVDALPLQTGAMVRHRLVEEKPHAQHERRPHPEDYARYLQENGLITQCAACRRTRSTATGEWDWVPAWVERQPPLISHGICPGCAPQFSIPQ